MHCSYRFRCLQGNGERLRKIRLFVEISPASMRTSIPATSRLGCGQRGRYEAGLEDEGKAKLEDAGSCMFEEAVNEAGIKKDGVEDAGNRFLRMQAVACLRMQAKRHV